MSERTEAAVICVTLAFFGCSFWPVVCGWVDLMTVAGWLELFGNFASLVAVIGFLTLLGVATAGLLKLVTWGLRLVHPGRAVVATGSRGVAYHALERAWRCAWWTAWYARRATATLVPRLRPDNTAGSDSASRRRFRRR